MHEVGLMESALHLAINRASEQNATRIHRIVMRVGVISGAVPDSLAFAFDIVSMGTMAEGAELEIESLPAILFCRHCEKQFVTPCPIAECPECGGYSHEVIQGRELELATIEVT